ncbi:uncharacterized protein LOC107273551 [Cephus cinctus]|uniref:Uncharacterized protein LOC107273551 n=1 Tax=Cephus cinctus TaxID=211228 RepID=A0AAJ7FTE9_CEPCN|nr:uncharacterized protein LOC107273551 [Cephus cinctus]
MAFHAYIYKQYIPFIIIPTLGFIGGLYLERLEDERWTMFRDKSALYGKPKAPGEPPSW